MVLHHCIQGTSEAPTGSRAGNPESSVRLRLQERTLAGILCGWQRNDSHQARKVQNNTYIRLAFTTAIFFFIRMYPYIVVTPTDLNPGMQYVVVLRIVPVDNKRYKYTNGLWHAVGGSDAIVDSSRMSFKHPTTPA